MYQTVFELSDRWPELGLHTLIAISLGAIASLFVGPLRRSQAEFRLVYAAALGVPIVAAMFVALVTLLTFSSLVKLERAASTGRAVVVEGPVTHFVEGRARTKTRESFSVEGVNFSYAESLLTAGFNHTAERGGPVSADDVVRVTYVGDTIIKLEIRD